MASIIGTPYQGTHNRGNWESDNAYDIAYPKGTPLRAVVDGRIGVSFGYNPIGGWRLHLIGGGTEFYYAHLSRYEPGILAGRKVKRGQIIAYSGDSGNARGTTPHLHFAQKPPGNPSSYIGALTSGGGSVPVTSTNGGQTVGFQLPNVPLPGMPFDPNKPTPIPGVGTVMEIGEFLGKITEKTTWIRVGEVVGGAVLIFSGLRILAKESGIQLIPTAAKKAAAVAATKNPAAAAIVED